MASLTAGGYRLMAFIDGFPIDTQWLTGHRIVWQTGQQNGPDGIGPSDHTHCSAFVAALALDLNIYILRPPNHGQELLADAQMAWLGGGASSGPTAAESGWRSLGSASGSGVLAAAVDAANQGKLVFAGYNQPPVGGVQRSGHVVAVRPQTTIDAEAGPQVVMAGTNNWRAISMRSAFESHAGAWPDGITVYVHDTDLEQQFTPNDSLG